MIAEANIKIVLFEVFFILFFYYYNYIFEMICLEVILLKYGYVYSDMYNLDIRNIYKPHSLKYPFHLP